jgi:uroporphyrin-III C-methyltransferase / precorrin-2 dehydrogenase / sirohydrochlorin ferrochelatase
MRYFPIFLDLRERTCLVVGDTEEARRKAATLRSAGAMVDHEIALRSSWSPAVTYALAVVATSSEETDAAAARLLWPLDIPLNVVDRPELCSFIWPAIVDRDPVTIAISTAGTSPTLAKLIRQRIERAIPAAVGELAALAGQLRRRIHTFVPAAPARRAFWHRVLHGPAGMLAFAGQADAALVLLRREAEAPTAIPPR